MPPMAVRTKAQRHSARRRGRDGHQNGNGARGKASTNGHHRRPAHPAPRPGVRAAHTTSFAPGKAPSHSGPSVYSKALKFLASLADYERLRIVRYNSQNFDLDRMRTLLKKLGNPQERFKSIHIAGTKGKGSTCAMVASMMEANGYKVGLYTSPHLIDIRERIAVNHHMIPHAEFARLVRIVEPIARKMRPMPTYFDVLTAVAFKYFAEQG